MVVCTIANGTLLCCGCLLFSLVENVSQDFLARAQRHARYKKLLEQWSRVYEACIIANFPQSPVLTESALSQSRGATDDKPHK